jgi:hypothetical protein
MAISIYDISSTITGGAHREDLMDVINLISPTDTPCYTMFRKAAVSNVLTEWLTDKLDAAGSNIVVEGATATSPSLAARTRHANYTQISREVYEVSDTLRAVNAAGIRDEFRYHMGKAMRQWKRDVEYDIVQGGASVSAAAGHSGDAANSGRRARGIESWMFFANTLTACAANSTLNVQEDDINARLMAVWTNGGLCDYILCTPLQKRAISSGFAGSVNSRRNMQMSENTVVNVVDFYLSDFGQVKVLPHRWFASAGYQLSGGGPITSRATFLLQSDKWVLGFLRPPKNIPLSKLGSSERSMVEGEWTLICLHPSANSMLLNHASGTYGESYAV